MPVMSLFKTTTSPESPLDASTGTDGKPAVSDFLTVQTLSNFAAMTGAITAAWHALEKLTPHADTIWVPYICAFAWGFISLVTSLDGLKKSASDKVKFGTFCQAVFIAAINSLVLGGAVVGTNAVTGATP